jgi:transposase
MESTGVYWQSPYNLMEGHFEQVMIVNAEHLKRVPGHKTDKKDAEWIAERLQLGLLKPSFWTGQPYQEKGASYFSERDRQHAERRLTKQLERLGYQVTLTPAKIA